MDNNKSPIFAYFVAALIIGGFVGAIAFGFMHQIGQSVICIGVVVTTIAVLCLTGGINIRTASYFFILALGLALIILPACLLYAQKNPEFHFWSVEQTIIYSGLSAIFLAGVGLIFNAFSMKMYIKKYCTAKVTAKCVDLEKRAMRRVSGHGHAPGRRPYVYRPTWEYTWNGTQYKYKDTDASNIGVPEIGNEYELMINPEKPGEAFWTESSVRIGEIVMGIICILNALVAVYFLMK